MGTKPKPGKLRASNNRRPQARAARKMAIAFNVLTGRRKATPAAIIRRGLVVLLVPERKLVEVVSVDATTGLIHVQDSHGIVYAVAPAEVRAPAMGSAIDQQADAATAFRSKNTQRAGGGIACVLRGNLYAILGIDEETVLSDFQLADVVRTRLKGTK